jgi:hypothetical protein
MDNKVSTKFQYFWSSGDRVLGEFLFSNMGWKNKV